MNATEACAESRSLKAYATATGDRLWGTTTSRNERVADVADAEAAARESENAGMIAWMTFDVKARHSHRDDIVSPF